jgi:hypothetical protein
MSQVTFTAQESCRSAPIITQLFRCDSAVYNFVLGLLLHNIHGHKYYLGKAFNLRRIVSFQNGCKPSFKANFASCHQVILRMAVGRSSGLPLYARSCKISTTTSTTLLRSRISPYGGRLRAWSGSWEVLVALSLLRCYGTAIAFGLFVVG